MTYSLEDIELMISNLPKHRAISSLDESFAPQRRHLKVKAWHLPLFTRGRRIINSLIQRFQDNPIELESDFGKQKKKDYMTLNNDEETNIS